MSVRRGGKVSSKSTPFRYFSPGLARYRPRPGISSTRRRNFPPCTRVRAAQFRTSINHLLESQFPRIYIIRIKQIECKFTSHYTRSSFTGGASERGNERERVREREGGEGDTEGGATRQHYRSFSVRADLNRLDDYRQFRPCRSGISSINRFYCTVLIRYFIAG